MPRPKLVPELYCSDFARSLKFYTEILGFSVRYARPEQHFAYLDRDGAELMIEQTLDPSRLFLAGPLEQPFGRGMHFQIEVGDIMALHQSVAGSEGRILLALEDRWYRRDDEEVGNRQFVTTDPDGYVLRFFRTLVRGRSGPGRAWLSDWFRDGRPHHVLDVGAPVASITSRSKPSAMPLASGICARAARKSSSTG